MQKTYKDIPLAPITEGVISDGTLSQYAVPEGSLSYAENLNNDSIGVVSLRPTATLYDNITSRTPFPGSSMQANEASAIYTTEGGTDFLIFSSNGTVFKQQISTYAINSTALAITAGSPIKVFQSRAMWLQDAGATNNVVIYDGSASVSVNVSFPDTVDIFTPGYIGRVWASSTNDYTCRVYYTDVIPASGATPGIESITGSGQYIQLNPEGNETITALVATQNVLFVFMRNKVYRIYNTESADNSPCAEVGAISWRAIAPTKDGVYFANQQGIYKLDENGNAVEVSQRIRDWVTYLSAIFPNSTSANVVAWADEHSVYFQYGYSATSTPAIYGLDTDRSYIFKYTIATQVWSVHTLFKSTILAVASGYPRSITTSGFFTTAYKRFPFTFLYLRQPGTTTVRVCLYNNYDLATRGFALLDGNVWDVPLTYATQWFTFGSEVRKKSIKGLSIAHTSGAGLSVGYMIDNDDSITANNSNSLSVGELPSLVKPIGKLDGNRVTLFRDFVSEDFNRIKFVIYGVSTGVVSIGQITVLSLNDIGYNHT